jgi:hypothetical protein
MEFHEIGPRVRLKTLDISFDSRTGMVMPLARMPDDAKITFLGNLEKN